jgi:hypothetical protein
MRSLLRTVALLSTLTLGACSETLAEDYETYADAEADGAVTRGWLPVFVPRSAFEIREVHDLDTNRQWLRFKVPPGDTTVLVGATDYPLRVAPEAGPPRQMGRWSAELRDPPLIWQHGSRVRTYQHVATSSAAAWCFAFDHATHEVFAWSCSAR